MHASPFWLPTWPAIKTCFCQNTRGWRHRKVHIVSSIPNAALAGSIFGNRLRIPSPCVHTTLGSACGVSWGRARTALTAKGSIPATTVEPLPIPGPGSKLVLLRQTQGRIVDCTACMDPTSYPLDHHRLAHITDVGTRFVCCRDTDMHACVHTRGCASRFHASNVMPFFIFFF